jgi:hypothetical protein
VKLHWFPAWLALLPLQLGTAPSLAQSPPSVPNSAEPIPHISSDLVLLDVEAMNASDGHPVSTLERADFQILDNDRPVAIKTFDAGAATRPLALWFVVQCNMHGWETRGSGLFAGQIERFRPALEHLDKRDKVAVAAWCDDGQAQVELAPTNHIEQAVESLGDALAPRPDTPSHDRSGELALQKTLQLIVDSTRSMPSDLVPVIVFLYGDFSAMPKPEANQFIGELLATSAICFGLRDRRSPRFFSFMSPGEQGSIANYIATQTGGEYFWVTPESYASGLEKILEQLHARYELGFKPNALDGKRHKLQVKLAEHARMRGRRIRLRYRDAYVSAPQASY